jgi:hypothetical protein
MSPRLVAPLAALALLLPATIARADSGPPAPSPYAAPPGYAAPPVSPAAAPPAVGQGYPGGYAAPGPYGAPPAPPGYYPPPQTYGTFTPMRRKSSVMIGAGAILLSVAATALIAGPSLYSGSQQGGVSVCPVGGGFGGCASPSTDSGAGAAGIALMVVGIAALGAGVPLLIIGAQKVPDRGDATVRPSLQLGAGRASVGVSF